MLSTEKIKKNYHDTVISVELSLYIYILIYTQIYSLTIGW